MSKETRKTNLISKETRDAIKKFLTSNISQSNVSRQVERVDVCSKQKKNRKGFLSF